MSTLEKRIEALEAQRRGDCKRIAVLRQTEDGSWPDAPVGASIVVGIRNFLYEAGAPAPSCSED